MTFIDYLKSQDIDNGTPGSEGIVYAVIAAMKPGIEYREASLLFADVPVIRETFERLWSEYEDATDLLRSIEGSEIDSAAIFFDRCGKEPEDVYTITGRVLEDLKSRIHL